MHTLPLAIGSPGMAYLQIRAGREERQVWSSGRLPGNDRKGRSAAAPCHLIAVDPIPAVQQRTFSFSPPHHKSGHLARRVQNGR